MSKEKRRVPKLRFPGFTEDWEQRKLGSIGSTYTGLSGKTKEDFGHGEAQYITYLNVFQNTISDITMTDKVEIDTTQNEVKYGDVLFTTSSETPEEVGMSSVWLGDTPNIYLNSFCFGFRPNQKINPYFLGYSLRAPYMRDKIKILAQGISRYNISKNKVMELEISLPNYEEQKLLGTFLQRIDLIITLHQRKLEHLNLKKKALLQKLFPKNGECYPELRFPGFTDAWEQCKFGEIFEYLQNNTLSRDSLNYKNPNIKNIHYGDILVKFDEILDGSNKDIPYINSELDLSKFSKSLLRDGDIIFSDTAEDDTVGKAIELRNVNAPFILGGLHTIPCRPLIPFGKGYLGNFLNSDSYRLQLRPLIQGIKVSSISKSALKDTMIEYPKNLDEQEKIGSLFYYIAKMITLHQRKLEHLQLQKKALLQQMFV